MKLQRRLILLIGVVFLIAFLGLEAISYQRAKVEAVADLRMLGERLYQVLMSVRRVYHRQFLDSGIELTDRTLGFLPAHAMARIALDYSNWDKSGLSFNNVSDIPRNLHQQADPIEREAMAYFRGNPGVEERFVPFVAGGGELFYHFSRPIWIEPYCLKCHGPRDQAPPTIRDRYATAYDYQVGELRGVMSIKLPARHIRERAMRAFVADLGWHGGAFLVLYLLVGLAVRRYVGVPLRRLGEAIDAVAAGNLATHIGPLPGELGRIGQTFDHMADALTEERDRLTRSQERFRSITDSTPDAIVVIDAEGLIRLWNPGAERIFGYPASAVLGGPLDRIIPEDARSLHRAALARLRQGQGRLLLGRTLDVTGCHRDGRLIPLDVSLSSWGQGDGLHFAAVMRDITERRRSERELAAYRQHLEEMVAARTAELQQAKDAAEAANRAKSVFLSNMSHELRTPLNAILGFAQILTEDPNLGHAQQEQTRTIGRSGQHLLALINDVLEISRIEAGRLAFVPQPFDLGETLRDVTEMIAPRARTRGLDFALEAGDGLPACVVGDAQRLRQVLLNLLGNAVKYADQGHIRLRVTAQADGQRVAFEVADEGPGIEPAEQAHIFDPFYQAAEGLARGEGVGLGLAIAHQFVQLMGGELAVVSRLGAGSQFCFELPLPASAIPCHAGNQARRVKALAPGQAGRRVLVVEDHADSRSLLLHWLTTAGLEVAGASNGAEAVERFRTWRPHLVLMDMRMPVLDGYAATRRIRELPGGDAVRILAVTAAAYPEDRAQVLAAGCDDLLTKPVQEAALFEALAHLLELAFDYQDAPAPAVDARATVVDLAALTEELRGALLEAAERLDGEMLRVLIEQIRPLQPQIAGALERLAEDFRFDEIQRLTGD